MTATTIALAYAALRAAAASHCYNGLIEDFKVTLFERSEPLSHVMSYRDPHSDGDMIHVNTHYVTDACQLAGSIAYLSTYKRVAASFPEPKYPVKAISQYFADQAEECCNNQN